MHWWWLLSFECTKKEWDTGGLYQKQEHVILKAKRNTSKHYLLTIYVHHCLTSKSDMIWNNRRLMSSLPFVYLCLTIDLIKSIYSSRLVLLTLVMSILYDTSNDSLCSIHIFAFVLLDYILGDGKRQLFVTGTDAAVTFLFFRFFIVKLTVVTSTKFRENRFLFENSVRATKILRYRKCPVNYSFIRILYNERSNSTVYLVGQSINTHFFIHNHSLSDKG